MRAAKKVSLTSFPRFTIIITINYLIALTLTLTAYHKQTKLQISANFRSI